MAEPRLELPHGWRRRGLGDLLASVDAGVSANAGDRPAKVGEHGILTLTAVVSGHFNPHANKAIENGCSASRGPSLATNMVLISRSNTLALVGRTVFVERDYPHLHLPDLLWALQVRDPHEIEPHWLHFFLTAPNQRRALQSIASGTSANMKKLSIGRLRRLPVDLPSITEQLCHVRLLRAWDDAEVQTLQLIRARRKMKRGLLQQLLTGQRRFPEFRKLRWRECRLRDVAEECNEPGRGTLGRDRIMGVTKSRGIVPMEDRLIGNVDRYQIVRKDWFAYNPMRLNIGSIARSHSKAPVLVSPDYVVFRCRDGELDPAFLDQYRKGHLWESFMRVCGAGSVRVRIYFNDLGRHKMHLPPIEEQRRIAEVLGALDDELAQLRQLHDALKEQKKGLMQKLLTGKVRVPASMLKESAVKA